jgi:hypothetical protein
LAEEDVPHPNPPSNSRFVRPHTDVASDSSPLSPAVPDQATRGSADEQIRSFVSDAAAVYPGITRIREEWEARFGYLAEEDAVVVVDEFPCLVEQTEALRRSFSGSGITRRRRRRRPSSSQGRYKVYTDDAYACLVEPERPDFVSGTFERLCQEAILYEYSDQYRFVEEPNNWWDGSGRAPRRMKTHS